MTYTISKTEKTRKNEITPSFVFYTVTMFILMFIGLFLNGLPLMVLNILIVQFFLLIMIEYRFNRLENDLL